MKLNPLGFLSVLLLLGVFGLVTEHTGMLGFFGFAVYLRYFFVKPDELFMQNVRKAASIGFFSGVAAVGLTYVLRMLALIDGDMVLVANFVVAVFCFTIALLALEVREQQGAKE